MFKGLSRLPRGYRRAFESIPGWFDLIDVAVFSRLDEIDECDRRKGDLLEIGAYEGKSAILIGTFVRPGEKFFVCDLFGQEPPTVENASEIRRDYATPPSQTRFEARYLTYHKELPIVMACPSSGLSRLADGAFRFIHVDGGHTYDIVRQDALEARRMIAPDGIVVFDDYRTFQSPGVAAAVWQSVLNGDLVPFCFTNAKLYASPREAPSRVAGLENWARADEQVKVERDQLLGHTILRMESVPSGTRQIIQAVTPPALLRVARGIRKRLRRRN